MFTIASHFVKGFAKIFGVEVPALSCKHCKETILFNTTTNPKKLAMKRHIVDAHPLLNRIYNH